MASFAAIAWLCLVLVLGVREGDARSTGAPTMACSTLTPNHGASSQPLPGGYFIYSSLIDSGGSYTSGTAYTLTLQGDSDFRGFLIQAVQSGTSTLIGSFSTPTGVQHLNCGNPTTATVTHTNANLKSSIVVTWTAPSNTGTVQFYYTVVQAYSTFYANIDSSIHRPPPPPSTMQPPPAPPVTSTAPTTSTLVIVPAVTTPATPASSTVAGGGSTPSPTPAPPPPAGCPATDKAADSDFSITFGVPVGCSRQTCNVYVAMSPNTFNSSYLDIYMEGTAAGWVAVGFSDSREMANTDVIGCRVDTGSVVNVVDTWNPSPNYSPNRVDATQDGVCTYSASYNGGRISCLLSRYGPAIDVGQDLDWNTDRYIIFGRRSGSNGGAQNLVRHSETPVRTMNLINVLSPGSPSTIECPSTDKNGSQPFSNFTFGVPDGCSQADCDVYVTMAPNTMNSSFLDIYMEGNGDGWVAVGFSDSRLMENTDVIGCRVDTDDMVRAVDTWNPSPNYLPNQVDTSQEGVCLHSSSFTDRRIRCLVSRYGPAIDAGMDLNWNTAKYIIYGRRSGSNSGDMGLLRHSETPSRTAELANPFDVTGDAPRPGKSYEKILLQVHGMLMLFAWPVLATVAIFFASWMKPALPNGEWFQTHRALLIISLFTTAAGFIFPFVALAENPIPGLINFTTRTQQAHFAIGILVFLLQIANPIVAIFRCKPNSPNRWIFNVVHASFIGVVAEILAFTNVGLGLSLFGSKYALRTSFSSLWTFIGYVVIIIILEVVLHVVFTIIGLMAPPEDRAKLMPTMVQWCFQSDDKKEKTSDYEMKESKEQNSKEMEAMAQEKKERKPPSKDAPLRWAGTIVLLLSFTLIFAVAIMVIIG